MELLKHITAEDIEKYGVVAAPDKLEGDPKANKMVFDRLVREMVAGAFNSAVDVINATMIAAEGWGKEEAERVEAELARIAAENLRAAAEAARAAEETARSAAETIRETNERNRQSRETAREQAEESRADAESAREAAEQARKTQEATRAMEETARVNGEVVRGNNEQTRQSQESTRQTNEQTRQEKEAERQRQEATRQANEQTRQTAEQSRASGESARGANEKARAAAEELRVSAENSRATAENLRASAETNRASAENLRAAAETDRASAEAGRKTAETGRVTAESKRETAETNRASAETARANAEQTRASAETSRANAEDLRAAAETVRVNEEKKRVDAEAARVAAEKIREEAYQSRKVVQETGNSTTAVMSQAAVTKELNQLSNEKVDQNQGAENVGKILAVGTDGNLVLVPMPEGGADGDVVGSVDESNNILLTGDLADGTYTIKYEMDDGSIVNIGSLVVSGIVYVSITNNLTNCTTNNSATQAVKGESYSATITADSGYELSTVEVTMAGNPVTVSGGVINIAEVTGNIVITAVAEETVVLTPKNFCVPNGDGWIENGRCSSTGEDRTNGAPGNSLSNYIAVQNGDTVYVENADISTASSMYCGIYKADKTAICGFIMNSGAGYVKDVDLSSAIETFTIDNADAGYVRIVIKPHSTYADVIITIKRNGEWVTE